jgi:hypothetical protein
MIKEKYILKFQRLYKKVYKKDLSRDEAYSQCMDMIILGQIIYSPFTKDELKALEQLKKY